MAEPDWQKHLNTDPCEDIRPSLLSSDDIHRYATKGCLVSEYDKDRLLPAGYQLRFLGKLIYWKQADDGKLERVEKRVKDKKPIALPGNSIAYLHMHEEFRMPRYIAARFNLRIRHVHQGLLLGTGPIVDPGFYGQLLVPLHNLTDNDYLFMGGDSFIHVEFTKLNPLPRWRKGADPKKIRDNYVEFSGEKITNTADYYFHKASVLDKDGVVSNLNPLRVEVMSALSDIRALSKEIKDRQKRTNWIGWGGIVALLALFFSVFTVVFGAYRVLQGVNDTFDETNATLAEVKAMLEERPNNLGATGVATTSAPGQAVSGNVGSSVSTGAGQQMPRSVGTVPDPVIDAEAGDNEIGPILKSGEEESNEPELDEDNL